MILITHFHKCRLPTKALVQFCPSLTRVLHNSGCVYNTWRSGCVMDCHATARGSIPGGNGEFTELHVLRKGQ